jgi:hypothetical protein
LPLTSIDSLVSESLTTCEHSTPSGMTLRFKRRSPGDSCVDQPDFFCTVVDFLNQNEVPYAIVGSVASIAFGETRMTADMDVLADLSVDHVTALVRWFSGPDWYVSEPAVREAVRQRRQFNVIHTLTGHKVDVYLPRSSDDVRALRRAIQRILANRTKGLIAHPNDIIGGKMRFYSEGRSSKHLTDIASVLKNSASLIDFEELDARADELGMLPVWRSLVDHVKNISPLPPDFPPEESSRQVE